MARRSGKRRHRCKVGGRRAWWKGKKKEEKFYCSFFLENFEKPRWFKMIRKGTSDEDSRGIDFVVETYTNPPFVFVQIKSSETGRRKFWSQHSTNEFVFPIIVLVLNKYLRDNHRIRKLLFETIGSCVGLH